MMFLDDVVGFILLLSFHHVSTAVQFECLEKDDSRTCIDNAVCNNSYTTIRLEPIPYSMFSLELQLTQCCGTCLKINTIDLNHVDLEDLDNKQMKKADLIYPVLRKNKFARYDNRFFFIPILKHPGFTYVTEMEISSFELAVKSCLSMYPLYIICLMMSILFGFIFWIFETPLSKEDYSRCFPIGWLKGMWWSMVTMFSTGPESTPNSFIGRILTIIWLIVAVIMVSLMSSIITAAMVKPMPTPSISGARVGSLHSNLYSRLEILRHNGNDKTFPGSSMEDELSKLLTALRNKELDGVLVDKYRLRRFLYSDILKTNRTENDIRHADYPYTLTSIDSDGSMAYGALVALNDENNVYFHTLFARESLTSEIELLDFTKLASFIEKNMQEKANSNSGPLVFTINKPYVKDALIWLAVMIGVVVFIGIMYEMVRRKALCFASLRRVEDRQEGSC